MSKIFNVSPMIAPVASYVSSSATEDWNAAIATVFSEGDNNNNYIYELKGIYINLDNLTDAATIIIHVEVYMNGGWHRVGEQITTVINTGPDIIPITDISHTAGIRVRLSSNNAADDGAEIPYTYIKLSREE